MTKITKTATEAKGYEGFLQGLRLTAMGLDESMSRLDRYSYYDLYDAHRKDLKSFPVEMSVDYSADDVGDEHFDAIGVYRLLVRSPNPDKPALVMQCKFSSHFHTQGTPDPEHVRKFVSTELQVILWPYFRFFVSDQCSRMSIPPVRVPLIGGSNVHGADRSVSAQATK